MSYPTGLSLAIFEVGCIFIPAYIAKCVLQPYQNMNMLLFMWTCFTIATGVWETGFIVQYNTTCYTAKKLLDTKEHVWTNTYNMSYLLPWKFSNIFYAEYGAYADREYMIPMDNWSRTIEGSHAIMCGCFALFGMFFKYINAFPHYMCAISICMGAQLMNSVLYMINYFHQTQDKTNVNYNTIQFPTGNFLEKRPFMYINIFWTIMPTICIINLLSTSNKKSVV